ncbi:MAG: peptidylprolyl isomerase [Ruminococcus sp.]|nr:peptidylprolyl isomerase [Ruminococcus sp.]
MLKKMLAVLVCTFTITSVFSSCGKEAEISENSSLESVDDTVKSNVPVANFTAPEKDDTIITMNIRDYGTVKIRLFPEYADKGVENFIGLAEKGYYDGLTFHRVIKDFMIQGGDPNGNGTGGESLWGGKFDGGSDPHLINCAGALAYANSGALPGSDAPPTSTDGSQFYIVTGTVCSESDIDYYKEAGYNISEEAKAIYTTAGGTPWLDGSYTVFGQVFDGLDIIFQIQNVTTDTGNDKPMKDVIIDSVTVDKYNGEDLNWYITDYEGYDAQSAEQETLPVEQVPIKNFTEPEIGDKIVSMTLKDYGEVKIRLFPEYADKGVENFLGLAEQGYYDGLTFHRIINDFMIQGGDPEGTGRGGESIWGGEFEGGTDPHLIHCAGAVAYANSGATSTNGSQFYIVTGEVYDDEKLSAYEHYGYSFTDEAKQIYKTNGGTPFLDGSYTVFGQVYDGLNIIFEVQQVTTDESDKPFEDVIIESMKVGEYDGSGVKWNLSDYEGTAPASDDTETDETVSDDTTGDDSSDISTGFFGETLE